MDEYSFAEISASGRGRGNGCTLLNPAREGYVDLRRDVSAQDWENVGEQEPLVECGAETVSVAPA